MGHAVLVFEMMDINMYELIKANRFKGFALNIVRRLAIEILVALKYIHS